MCAVVSQHAHVLYTVHVTIDADTIFTHSFCMCACVHVVCMFVSPVAHLRAGFMLTCTSKSTANPHIHPSYLLLPSQQVTQSCKKCGVFYLGSIGGQHEELLCVCTSVF